jgi:hypothetical protein
MAGKAFQFPRGFTRPCRAAQWNDGVLTTRTTAVSPNPPSQQWQFDDFPIGLAPDGSGGAFVLVASSWVGWPYTQGPLSFARISPTGIRGPVTALSPPIAWVGVLGVWSDGAIVGSGSGRSIVVWADSQLYGGRLVAQRYDVAGQPSWTPDPVTASSAPPDRGFSSGIVAEPDGSDGVITAWCPQSADPASSPIRVQRLSATGTLLYGTDGLSLGPAAVPPPRYSPLSWLQLVPDGQGGATVLWTNETGTGADHVAQKVSGSGAALGAPVTVVSQASNGWRSLRRARRAVSDGARGFFLAYPDQAGLLQVRRCSATTTVLWTLPVVTPTHPMAFDLREDGQGGILLAVVSTNVLPRLVLWRIDGAGSKTWELNALFQFLLPSAAATWPAHAWADLVKVVPDGSGGALVVLQFWRGNGSKPRLNCFCVDAQGALVGSPGEVSTRPTSQDLPVVISGGGPSAIVAWADDGDAASAGLDVWTQRVGCCPPSPITGLEWEPPVPCAIVELPGPPYRELAVRLPCGDRDRQFGVLPLSRLGTVVRGLDLPGSLGNRATPAPDWMRITFLGLPTAISVTLQTAKAKAVGRSEVIAGPGKTRVGMALTFKPASKEEQFLVLSHKGAPMSEAGVRVRVNVEWGDGKPPALPQPARRAGLNRGRQRRGPAG